MDNKTDNIVTQDVYIPVEEDTDYLIKEWNREKAEENARWSFLTRVEKHTGMVVLTKQEFEKAIKQAKAEELKRIRDNDKKVDEWCNIGRKKYL